jgi:predicted N-formylglutamate amidohydrolase
VDANPDVVERIAARRPDAPVVVSCEHASGDFPSGFVLPSADHWLRETHWALDIGARELALDLARDAGAAAVLARFSRLLADPNRDEHAPDLFLLRAEGREVELNRLLDDAERERRMTRLWRRYHAALDELVAASRADVLLAVHTFTPIYDGVARSVELGVLFDREEDLAERFRAALAATGLDVRMNEPYTGRGLMYSADRHARAHGRRAIEIELRQDLAVSAEVRAQVVAAVRSVFS